MSAPAGITVKFFASLREQLGDQEILPLPPISGPYTVACLRAHLQARGGPYADCLGAHRMVRAAVNMQMVDDTALIPAGAEVAFFPPVTGG